MHEKNTKTNTQTFFTGLSLKPPSQPPSNLEGGEKAPLPFGEGFGERLKRQKRKSYTK